MIAVNIIPVNDYLKILKTVALELYLCITMWHVKLETEWKNANNKSHDYCCMTLRVVLKTLLL